MSYKNIKNLVYKDLRLVLPLINFFIFLILPSGMVFIPSYPRTVVFFYPLVCVSGVFNQAIQFRDHEASGLFPVQKRESVLARLITIILIELIVLLFSVPFAIIAASVMSDTINYAGMSLNLTLYSITLIGYAFFNFFTLPGGFQKNFKVTVRLPVGMCLFFAVMGSLEAIVRIPHNGKLFLNGTGGADIIRQIPFFIGALIIFLILNYIAFKKASRRYENAEI